MNTSKRVRGKLTLRSCLVDFTDDEGSLSLGSLVRIGQALA